VAQGLRIVLQTQVDWADVAALSAKLSQVAGLPVRDVGALSPKSFSATLVCPGAPASCQAALQRVAEAHDFATEAHADAFRTIPRPISPASSAAR